MSYAVLEEIAGANDVPRTWSIEAFAADVATLLTDPVRAEARVGHLRSAIDTYTWGRFADQLVEFMERIERLPPADGALVGGTAADAAALAAVLGSKTWRSAQALRKITRLGR